MKTTILALAAFYGLAPGSDPVYTGESQPTALASADFDEDGRPDLVGSYRVARGAVVLRLGAERVFQLPEPRDVLGAIRGLVITDYA